ncbi:sensor histidine kinase [Streptomyces sp. NPDC001070]
MPGQQRQDFELLGAQTAFFGVVRTSADTGEVWQRILLACLALAAVALSAVGVALLVARHQARALTRPLEALAATVAQVTDGDLTAGATPSGIAEIDQVGATHNDMVERLGGLLRHEREFAANASHQLRTALTGLQLGPETALSTAEADLRAATREALAQSRYLQHTIDEVLQLARSEASAPGGPAVRCVGEVLEQAERRWHGPLAQDGRRLTIAPESGTARLGVPGRTSDQILDILLDNAHRHGHGTVRVTVPELGEWSPWTWKTRALSRSIPTTCSPAVPPQAAAAASAWRLPESWLLPRTAGSP